MRPGRTCARAGCMGTPQGRRAGGDTAGGAPAGTSPAGRVHPASVAASLKVEGERLPPSGDLQPCGPAPLEGPEEDQGGCDGDHDPGEQRGLHFRTLLRPAQVVALTAPPAHRDTDPTARGQGWSNRGVATRIEPPAAPEEARSPARSRAATNAAATTTSLGATTMPEPERLHGSRRLTAHLGPAPPRGGGDALRGGLERDFAARERPRSRRHSQQTSTLSPPPDTQPHDGRRGRAPARVSPWVDPRRGGRRIFLAQAPAFP